MRNGDGILLTGKILYVVQNRDNKIARIALAARLDSGRITGYLTDPDFDVPDDDRRSRQSSLRGERPLRDDADADDPLRRRPGGEALSGRARAGQTSGILNVSPAP
ncbi:MAG: hypothetical protein WKF41_00365 [Gaiellaceae bacterium]